MRLLESDFLPGFTPFNPIRKSPCDILVYSDELQTGVGTSGNFCLVEKWSENFDNKTSLSDWYNEENTWELTSAYYRSPTQSLGTKSDKWRMTYPQATFGIVEGMYSFYTMYEQNYNYSTVLHAGLVSEETDEFYFSGTSLYWDGVNHDGDPQKVWFEVRIYWWIDQSTGKRYIITKRRQEGTTIWETKGSAKEISDTSSPLKPAFDAQGGDGYYLCIDDIVLYERWT